MKYNKILLILTFVLLLITLNSKNIFAQTYTINDTDMTISIDESKGYVFTRDNIYNNKKLSEIGVTYDYMNDIMYERNLYLDSLLYIDNTNDFLEVSITKQETDGIKNFTNFNNDEILKEFKKSFEKNNITDYEIYEYNHPFLHFKKVDLGFYIDTYSTIVNGYSYKIVFQKQKEFSTLENLEKEKIINSIQFNIDTTLEEPASNSSIDLKELFISGITGGIVCVVAAFLNNLIKNKFY